MTSLLASRSRTITQNAPWILRRSANSRNCAVGDFIHVDAARNIIFDARKNSRTPIAIVGLRDSILVLTDDATLLAHKSHAQRVKELVKKLAESKEYRNLV